MKKSFLEVTNICLSKLTTFMSCTQFLSRLKSEILMLDLLFNRQSKLTKSNSMTKHLNFTHRVLTWCSKSLDLCTEMWLLASLNLQAFSSSLVTISKPLNCKLNALCFRKDSLVSTAHKLLLAIILLPCTITAVDTSPRDLSTCIALFTFWRCAVVTITLKSHLLTWILVWCTRKLKIYRLPLTATLEASVKTWLCLVRNMSRLPALIRQLLMLTTTSKTSESLWLIRKRLTASTQRSCLQTATTWRHPRPSSIYSWSSPLHSRSTRTTRSWPAVSLVRTSQSTSQISKENSLNSKIMPKQWQIRDLTSSYKKLTTQEIVTC